MSPVWIESTDGARSNQDQPTNQPTILKPKINSKKTSWKLCLFLACFLYVLVSLTELPAFGVRAPRDEGKEWYEIVLEAICNGVFVVDIYMQGRAKGFGITWRNRWTQIFAVLLVFDFVGVVWQGMRLLKVTGIVRAFPIVYYSKRARNAMINYSKTLPSVMLWIGACLRVRRIDRMCVCRAQPRPTLIPTERNLPTNQPTPPVLELFIIVLYSCVTVVMYAHLDRAGVSGQTAFEKFSSAFISLYSLSLTVNDPDVYLVRVLGVGGFRDGCACGRDRSGLRWDWLFCRLTGSVLPPSTKPHSRTTFTTSATC